MEYKSFTDRWPAKEKVVFKIKPYSKQEVKVFNVTWGGSPFTSSLIEKLSQIGGP